MENNVVRFTDNKNKFNLIKLNDDFISLYWSCMLSYVQQQKQNALLF